MLPYDWQDPLDGFSKNRSHDLRAGFGLLAYPRHPKLIRRLLRKMAAELALGVIPKTTNTPTAKADIATMKAKFLSKL